MKVCTKCEESKPATKEYFKARKSCKNGIEGICKICVKKRDKQYNLDNKEKIRAVKMVYLEENKDKIANYHKNYRLVNGERLKESKGIYIEENKEQVLARLKRYRDIPENKEIASAYAKKYQEENKDAIKQRGKIYYELHKEIIKQQHVDNQESIKKYAIDNMDKISKRRSNWKKSNKDKVNVSTQKRRAIKKSLISTFSNKDLEDCLNFFNYVDAYTGSPMKKISQDHIIPIIMGGHYVRQNIVPCEKTINSSKGKSNMESWYKRQPFFSEERLAKIHEWIGMKNGHQQLSLI